MDAHNISTMLFQNQLRGSLIEKIRTGNTVADAVLGMILVSAIDRATGSLWGATERGFRALWLAAQLVRARALPKPKTVRAQVNFITEDREKNELYEVVHWYVYEHGKPLAETQVHFERTPNRRGVVEHPPRDHTAEFTWDNVKVSATIRSEVITIHAERSQQRENMIIEMVAETRDEDYFSRLIKHATDAKKNYDETANFTQKIYTNEGGNWSSHEVDLSHNRGENLVLKRGQKEKLMEDFMDFIESEEWYKSRNIPWTRGYMFYGKPGTGKSTFVKTMASLSNRHLYYLTLREIKNNQDLKRLLQINFKQSILVIEDIDADSPIVRKRSEEELRELDGAQAGALNDTPASAQGTPQGDAQRGAAATPKKPEGISLADLLGAIDGRGRDNHGQILVVTTNHPETLDEALVRGRRIDCKEEFGYCDEEQIHDLYANFYKSTRANDPQLSNYKPGGKIREDIAPADVVNTMLLNKNNPEAGWDAIVDTFWEK